MRSCGSSDIFQCIKEEVDTLLKKSMVDLKVWSTASLGTIIITVVAATVFYQGKKRMDKYSGHASKISEFIFGSQKDFPV